MGKGEDAEGWISSASFLFAPAQAQGIDRFRCGYFEYRLIYLYRNNECSRR
jgi:hypothetical protein